MARLRNTPRWLVALIAVASGPGCGGGSSGGVDSTGVGETAGGSTSAGGTGGAGGATSSAGTGGQLECAPGAAEPCYEGPAGTEGVGACKAGTRTCAEDGTWSACAGEVRPAAEVCTEGDVDCDGVDLECIPKPLWAREIGADNHVDDESRVATAPGGDVVLVSTNGKYGPGGALGPTQGFLARYAGATGEPAFKMGFGGEGADRAASVAVGSSGDAFVVGTFEGSADLGAGPLVSKGASDAFLGRWSPAGAAAWTMRLGGDATEAAPGLALDAAGDLLVAGWFEGSMDVGATSLTSAGKKDLFVAKISADGAVVWAHRFGGPEDDLAHAVSATPDGGLVVVGGFGAADAGTTETDFGGGPRKTVGARDVVILHLDASGARVWDATYGSPGADEARAVAVNASGRVLVSGSGEAYLDFGAGPIAGNFLASFDAAAGHLWSRGIDEPAAALAFAKDGAPLVVGGSGMFWLARFTETGETLGEVRWGSGGSVAGTGLAVDPNTGNVVVSGRFWNYFTFGGFKLSGGGATLFVGALPPP